MILQGGELKGRSKLSTKKLTQEQFIERCIDKHDDTLDFSQSVYVNSRTPVYVICPTHGPFWKSSKNLMNGVGCYHCRWQKYVQSRRLTTEQFIAKAAEIHNDYYDYSKTNYVNSRTLVTITCPIHGDFTQGAGGHLEGYGCKKCGDQKHGDYRPWLVKTYFERFPEKKDIPAKLYLLYCPEEGFYKVGITRQEIEIRHKYIAGYTFDIVDKVESTFYNVSVSEQKILAENNRYTPKHKFGGYTECLSNFVDIHSYIHP